ncbi:DNA-binding protein [Bradyrhizobium arachidis]|uniref:DNA-binding protein n=1 Tax=Bradyrhizobium arachidis TaxID=858423 RepID=UPI002161351A|nr:DNA-binding protein [Bradyrhizobium arachidis]UVO40215.1 DNA-binding protein [Bradyrhizobium arachidis]
MRSIKQPGAPVTERIQWVEARGRGFSFTLQAGLPLLEAARRGFAAEGFAGGVLNFTSGALGPFGYVMPALSKTGENAAFYSDTYRPAGVSHTRLGSMTLGVRDGAPFFHCHGLWTEADGKVSGGHMLPDETVVAEPFEVQAFGVDGAMFAAEPDPETNFKLFGPVVSANSGARTTSRTFALRLRPNQDFAGCLEAFCHAHRIARAKIHGGVGSTVGARFTHGGVTEPFATELAITAGTVAPGASGVLEAALDVALIDYTGGIAEGRLVRGDNPVLMTMELVLEALDLAHA